MKAGQVSLTALAVAVARGVGIPAIPADATAAAFLPAPVAWTLRRWRALPAWARGALVAPRLLSGGLVDHVSLRTAAIDRELARAIRQGASSMVILGAGFDGRAYRLPELADLDVFEVDHPHTCAVKRTRASALEPMARSVQHVPLDFDDGSLTEALADAGHDAEQPTVWLWEGVTPYLPIPAIDSTLRAIARRSARGSRMLMTYAVPQLLGRSTPRLDALVRASFAKLGEPLRGAMLPADAHQRVNACGLSVDSDTGQRAWAQHAGTHAWLARPLRAERLLVAERR